MCMVRIVSRHSSVQLSEAGLSGIHSGVQGVERPSRSVRRSVQFVRFRSLTNFSCLSLFVLSQYDKPRQGLDKLQYCPPHMGQVRSLCLLQSKLRAKKENTSIYHYYLSMIKWILTSNHLLNGFEEEGSVCPKLEYPVLISCWWYFPIGLWKIK